MESVMWWNHYSWSGEYWPMPMFFGPVIMILFVMMCGATLFLIVRWATIYRHRAGGGSAGTGTMACCGTGLGSSIQCVTTQDTKNGSQLRTDGHSAFDESRAETLRRLEQEQGEFQEFVDHLRMAKDKAEFDQFITERRTMPSAHDMQSGA
jgi:hypothetical protein